jgi:hypothetical protein
LGLSVAFVAVASIADLPEYDKETQDDRHQCDERLAHDRYSTRVGTK